MRTFVLCLASAAVLAGGAFASSLSRPQVLKELTDIEVCLRTMCIPAGEASMSIGGCQELLKKLAVNPNPLDRWVTQRVNAVVLDLKAKKLKDGLVHLQATIRELPQSKAPEERAGTLNGKTLTGFIGSSYVSLRVNGSFVNGLVGSEWVYWNYFGNSITGMLGGQWVNLFVNGTTVSGFAGNQYVSLHAF